MSRWGVSIASVSTEAGSLATRKSIEAISGLKSFWKPQSPKKIKSRQGEVKKVGSRTEKFPWNIIPIMTLLANQTKEPEEKIRLGHETSPVKVDLEVRTNTGSQVNCIGVEVFK